jgi:hypothetical protein
MTRVEQRQRSYRRELRKREADGSLSSWTPVRIGGETEQAPRWFRAAVRAAKAPVQAAPAPAPSVRPRERADRRRESASTGAPPDDPTHLAEPESGRLTSEALR